eukprot:scaffold28615_cov58-Phaeocystis_antarctica.AAC.1
MDSAIWILSGRTLGSLTPLGSGSAPSSGRLQPKVPSSFGPFCQGTWPRIPSTRRQLILAGRIEVGHVARLRVRLAELSQGRVSHTGVGWECERGLRAWLSAIGSRCCDGSDHRGRE